MLLQRPFVLQIFLFILQKVEIAGVEQGRGRLHRQNDEVTYFDIQDEFEQEVD